MERREVASVAKVYARAELAWLCQHNLRCVVVMSHVSVLCVKSSATDTVRSSVRERLCCALHRRARGDHAQPRSATPGHARLGGTD